MTDKISNKLTVVRKDGTVESFDFTLKRSEEPIFEDSLVFLIKNYELIFLFLLGLSIRFQYCTDNWSEQVGLLTIKTVKKLKTLKMS